MEEINSGWTKGIGGLWNEMGELQFEFLKSFGLSPHHTLLDVGCGGLRGGIHFIKYLEDGNYFGMDKNQIYIDNAVEIVIPKAGLEHRKYQLICNEDFNFSLLNMKFDYAIAQSVFTHLPWNSILRCLGEIKRVLKKSGRFFATFFEDEKCENVLTTIIQKPGDVTTYSYQNPYHYCFSNFEEMSKQVKLKVRYIGNWNHPRGQKMMLFTHP